MPVKAQRASTSAPHGALPAAPAGLPLEIPTHVTPKERTLGLLLRSGFLPNLIKDRLPLLRTVAAAAEAGIQAVEVSCRRPDTLDTLALLKRSFPNLAIGVSSLIEDGPYFQFLQARGPRFPSIGEAVDAGADFLVSLIAFSPETYSQHHHLPIIPGVESADEAKRQLDYGASLVKFSNFGAAQLRAVNSAPIHSGLPLLVTGGVRPEHVEEYVAAGVLLCVSGFDLILHGRYHEMQENFSDTDAKECVAAYVAAFTEARGRHRPQVDFASGDPRLIQRQSGQFLNVPMA